MAVRLLTSALDGTRLRPANGLMGALGHSIPRQGLIDNASGSFVRDIAFSIGSFPWWVSALSKGQFIADFASWGGAVSGTTTQQMVGTGGSAGAQITAAINSRASIIPMMVETNDRPAGFTLDDGSVVTLGNGGTSTIPNTKAMINGLVAAGKFIPLLVDPPRGTAGLSSPRLSGTQLQYHGGYRDWVLNTAPGLWPGRVFPIDTWPDGQNTVSGLAGDVLDNFTRDGLHPGTLYARPIAQRVLTVLQGLGVPLRQVPIQGMIDIYSASNPLGAIAPSTRIGGTGSGSAAMPANQGGVTYAGNRPSGYSINSNSAAQGGTMTVTGTRNVASLNGGQADMYQLGTSGTSSATAGASTTVQYALSAGDKTPLVAGNKLTVFGELEIAAGGTGIAGVDLQLIRTYGGGLVERIRTGYADETTGALDTLIASSGLSWLADGAGMSVTLDGTETDISFYVTVMYQPSATISATVRMRNMAVRRAA